MAHGISLLLMLALLVPAVAAADESPTVAHWRFEPDGFLRDVAGSHDLSAQGGQKSPAPFSFPEFGPGAAFLSPLPLTGAANLTGVRLDGGYFTVRNKGNAFAATEELTLELMFNSTYIKSSAASMLISRWSTGGNKRAWFFGLINTGSRDLPSYQLRFGSSRNGHDLEIRNSEFSADALQLGKDYYAAMVFKAGTVVFYLRNLTDDGPLMKSKITGLQESLFLTPTDLQIGAFNGNSNRFYGWLDEIRFSKVALKESELLIHLPVEESRSGR